MSISKLLATTVIAFAVAAPAANAAVTFTVVDATATTNSDFCANCEVTATPVAGLVGQTFSLGGLGDSETFDFLDWDVDAGFFGAGVYSVEASLAFNPPPGGIADTTGNGGGAVASVFGKISGGVLKWTSGVPNEVEVGNNVFATIDFEDGFAVAGKGGVTSTATVTISAVPVPASAALALFGVAGFAGYRRVQKAKQAA
jgi:hypothetical protein